MFAPLWNRILLAVLAYPLVVLVSPVSAATPTAAQALALTPIQRDAEYDQPSDADHQKCTVKAESRPGISGWVVRDAAGRFLRQFLDTNRDNKVDQWCYYKDGVETYRDIDSNFNGKADQYRWMGTAGLRWGDDPNEDGRIDSWRMISPEEVTAEVVAALRERDVTRFQRVMLSIDDVKALGLGEDQAKELTSKISGAASKFTSVAQQQQVVERDSKWVHFGGTRPGVVAAGTNGSTKDLLVYDNVTAVIETNGKHAQVVVGTLIRVGETWRVVDLPTGVLPGQASVAPSGFFFNAAMHRPAEIEESHGAGVSEAVQKLMTEFESADRSLASAKSATQKASLHDRRAEILEKLVAAVETAEERTNWIRQYSDTIAAAIQTNEYPGGTERLKSFYQNLAKEPGNAQFAGYVKYRYLNANYSKSLQEPDADFAKIQQTWLEDLEQFVKDFPRSEDAPDAMLQLALAQEFAGKEDEAKKWYKQITDDFASSDLAAKAAGAMRRLDSVGKTITLRGQTADGRTFDLSAYRGRVVLIHYWATWCEPCKQEMSILKDLLAKYGRQGLEVIGISLDSNRQELNDFLRTNRLPWPQLFEDGGLDSRLANELGILTLPAMILVDKQGQVISRNIHAGELDAELGKHLAVK